MIFRPSRRFLPSLRRAVWALACLLLSTSLHAADPGVNYASFVCWKYRRLPQLAAWTETEKVIAATLAQAYPNLHTFERQENGTPDQLCQFLRQLPDDATTPTLVYLAAHQTPGGQWFFTDGTPYSWKTVLDVLPDLKGGQRLVLLDCCFARAAGEWPDWTARMGFTLFAASPTQPTPDLAVFHRRPVDWAVSFPKAIAWMRQHDPGPEQRLSYLGLVWLEAWQSQPQPPRTWEDWQRLTQAMTDISARTSADIRDEYMSQIGTN